jgi:uncharacterized NAD-dependent epimerase/dehydratase family protein
MKRRIVILAEKKLGSLTSKMANGAIRYLNEEVIAIIDSNHAGKVVQDVLNFGGDIPIYSSFEETLQHQTNTLLIGISPPGGKLPSAWYPTIINAIQNKLNIVSGLHEFIKDVAEFRILADKYNVKLIDLRKYNKPDTIARGLARNFQSRIILTVGTHGNVGKMTATIEMVKQLQRSGKSADWIASGQIGILIKGRGVPVDALKGDFISGALESEIARADGNYEYIFVEGQGSLQHLGYSSVATGILHGSLPDAMILCHRSDIGVSDYGINTNNMDFIIKVNEQMVSLVKPSKVVAIAINTYNLSEDKALHLIDNTQRSTGLPSTDPIRFGSEKLTNALLDYFKSYKKKH